MSQSLRRPKVGALTVLSAMAGAMTFAAFPGVARGGVVLPEPAGEAVRSREAQAAPAPAVVDWQDWDLARPFGWSIAESVPAVGADAARAAASVERLPLPQLSEAETAAAAAQVEAEATGAWHGLPAPAAPRAPIAFLPSDSDDPRPPAIPIPPGAMTGLGGLAVAATLATTRRVRRRLIG